MTRLTSGAGELLSSLAIGYRDDGDDPSKDPLTVFEWVGLYVGLPILLFAVIALLVYAPGLAKGPRYRPGWAWWHEPVWFAGPAGDDMTTVEPGAGTEPGPATLTGGGARARW